MKNKSNKSLKLKKKKLCQCNPVYKQFQEKKTYMFILFCAGKVIDKNPASFNDKKEMNVLYKYQNFKSQFVKFLLLLNRNSINIIGLPYEICYKFFKNKTI